jgi:copper resistance protein B
MKRLLILLLAAASAPALAQHAGHHPPAPATARPAPPAARTATQPRPARPRAVTPPRRSRAARPARPPSPADPHAGHGAAAPAQVPVQPAETSGGHAGHDMAAPATADPHAGHGAAAPEPAPAQAAESAGGHAGHDAGAPATPDPHAGHGAGAPASADAHAGHEAEAPLPPVGPPPPAALSGPDHAADGLFDPAAMAAARAELLSTHGGLLFSRFSIDQLEIGIGAGRETFSWEDAQVRYGGDLDSLWLKSEGEGSFGEGLERGDVQALWSHAIDPWFDLQTGVRMNFGRGPERPHLVLGVQGLAPYWFEVDAALFLSSKGDLTARAEVEYDLRLAQRLILQPRVEAELALQDVPELGIGAGLGSLETGLRLRYEMVREFAPYVGLEYGRRFGDTARFARAAGEDAGGWRLAVGTRLWF